MISIIFGAILFIFPFLLLGLFNDKRKGFVLIFFWTLLFHLALAFFTQLFGIFYYKTVIFITAVADVVVLLFFINKIKTKKITIKDFKVDLIGLLIVAVAVLSLLQVHYNYTGKISLTTDNSGYNDAKNMKYEYPYFSDEWYSISLIKGSIQNHSLPLKNVLNNSFFLNLEMFTHSLLAELILLLNFNPLTQYVLLSVIINTFIIVLIYLFLRANNLSKPISAICSLSALYITSAANLPGIWTLIPISLGILFYLFGLYFMEIKDTKMMFLAFLVVSLYYPLLLPFYGTGILIYLFSNIQKIKENKIKIISRSLLGLFLGLPAIILIMAVSPLSSFLHFVISKLFYISFTGKMMPQYNIFYILPVPIIILFLFGLQYVLKNKKWFSWQLLVGMFFWVLYFFVYYRFIIEFERAVFLTSILMCITAGFGLKKIFDFIDKKFGDNGQKIVKTVQIISIVLFFVLIPFYTKSERWMNLPLLNPQNGQMVYARAPANKYLSEDDLRIFKDIKGKKFLSIPWKGTVIGVATDNYPAVTKEGTISVGSIQTQANFLRFNCQDKLKMAKNLKLDYVYFQAFNCPGFKKIDQSSEGFVLYKL